MSACWTPNSNLNRHLRVFALAVFAFAGTSHADTRTNDNEAFNHQQAIATLPGQSDPGASPEPRVTPT